MPYRIGEAGPSFLPVKEVVEIQRVDHGHGSNVHVIAYAGTRSRTPQGAQSPLSRSTTDLDKAIYRATFGVPMRSL